MKKWSSLFLVMALTLSLAACGQTAPASSAPVASSVPVASAEAVSSAPVASALSDAPTEKLAIRVAALKGPTAIGMVDMMDKTDARETSNNYEFTLAGAPDELVGKIVQGDFDIAAVPTNLAATLYNKTQGRVKMAALNTMGVLYIVENGETIKTLADLRGKTVYASGKGSTPEFVLNYLLEKNGLKVGTDVTVEYKAEHTELATMLAAGQVEIALLPEPFVTSVLMQNDKVRVALDLTKEWDATGAGGLTMGCVVVQQKFIDEHPEAVKAFLADYQSSTEFVNDPTQLDAVAEMVVRRGIIAKEPMAKKAIPACNIVFKAGEEMKTIASGFLKVLFDANPQSVGGKLPDENLYYLG